jgi:hypothetical protein
MLILGFPAIITTRLQRLKDGVRSPRRKNASRQARFRLLKLAIEFCLQEAGITAKDLTTSSSTKTAA